MRVRSSFLALAALAAVAATALVPNSASAHFGGGGWGGSHWGGGQWGGGHWAGHGWHQPSYGNNWYSHWHSPYFGRGPNYYGSIGHDGPSYPTYYGIQPVVQPPPMPAPPPVRPNCLSKSYVPDGTVVLADNCTKEVAASGPEGPPPPGPSYGPPGPGYGPPQGPPPNGPWKGNGS